MLCAGGTAHLKQEFNTRHTSISDPESVRTFGKRLPKEEDSEKSGVTYRPKPGRRGEEVMFSRVTD